MSRNSGNLIQNLYDLAERNPPAAYCLLVLFDLQREKGTGEWVSSEELREKVDRRTETERRKKITNQFSHAVGGSGKINRFLHEGVEYKTESEGPLAGEKKLRYRIKEGFFKELETVFTEEMRKEAEDKFIAYVNINASRQFWHMQLHPNDKNWGREKELLQSRGLIGLGGWKEKKGQIPNFKNDMKVGDIVAIKRGRSPIALVEVTGDYEYEADPGELDWFEHRRRVCVLDDEPMMKREFPSPRGTLGKCVNLGNDTSRYIREWFDMVGKGKQSREDSINRILYGPPGTGKTYKTVVEAVKICEVLPACEEHAEHSGDCPKCYEATKKRYNQLRKEGRIEFVTFHQSYGYEEFIEGIRAETEHGKVSYRVADGLLKELAFCATSADAKAEINFDQVYEKLRGRLERGEKIKAALPSKKEPCTIVGIKRNGSLQVEPANPRSDSGSPYSVRQEKLASMWPQRNRLNRPRDLDEFGLSTTDSSYYLAVLKKLEEIRNDLVRDFSHRTSRSEPYVLVIDEINRGNISKIFGELITLIEEDKRIGATHGMTVRLPLSGEEFGVPKNLYIIGTMNTADRSIAMMDTALRRRFEFVEKMPDPELLKDVKVGDIDIRKMLETMNQRIEVLYDREHTIGHAYFMPLKEKPELDLLAEIFEHKIIPLLAEYFFEDWAKIRMVLGDDQKENPEFEFITENSSDSLKLLFGDRASDVFDDWNGRKVYARNEDALEEVNSYRGIYEPACCKRAAAPTDAEKTDSE